MHSISSPQVQNFQYKIGLSKKEYEEIRGALEKAGFKHYKVIVEEALRETIPVCMGAAYKNPSSMRIDAPGAFSCSSLVSYLYTQAGVWMPSLSIDKYVFGTPISKEDLKFGDLVFSNTGEGLIRTETVEYKPGTKVPEGVDHVGMYMGNGEILHASKSIGKTDIEKIEESKNFKNIVGFRRFADTNEERYVILIPANREDLRKKEDLFKNLTNQ